MSTKFIRQFGENVRNARESLGISQEELAYRADLHRTQISLIERGQRTPRLDTIEQLAKALQIQPSKLIPSL
jgi:transcriptional regulator with XRE-family HTH domain